MLVVVVTVPATSPDNSLKSLKVDGVSVSVGDVIAKPFGTSAVTVLGGLS